MIISRTPYRISFVGGATDLEAYYRHGYGAVVSAAIKKYMYVAVNKKFDDNVRVSYSETEIVTDVNKLKHELVRECLKLTGTNNGIEVVTIGDVPGRGTGLGSSSSLTVGLLNALYAYQRQRVCGPETLAKEACRIEIEILGGHGGKQDQYIAAYGGLNYIRFNADETVVVEPIRLSESQRSELEGNLICFYTGMTRRSNDILVHQRSNTPNRLEVLNKMRDQADEVRKILLESDLTRFGEMLHEAWILKKQLAGAISNRLIDEYYKLARKAGALGGKISGAGGGGFLTLYCEKKKQQNLREALCRLRELEVKFEREGSEIIYGGLADERI